MKKGLYANIHAKRKSGKTMRKKGDAGAPSDSDFNNAAKTAQANYGMKMKKKYNKGGQFGMLSVKAGYDNNPKATAADRIVGAKKKANKGMKTAYGKGGSFRPQHD